MKKLIVVLFVLLMSVIFAELEVRYWDVRYWDYPYETDEVNDWFIRHTFTDAKLIDESTGNLNGYFFVFAVAYRFNYNQIKRMYENGLKKAVYDYTKEQIKCKLRDLDDLNTKPFKRAFDHIENEKKEVDRRFPGKWDETEKLLRFANGGSNVDFIRLGGKTGKIVLSNGNDKFEYKKDVDFEKFVDKLKKGYMFEECRSLHE